MLDDLKNIASVFCVSIIGLVLGVIGLIVTGIWAILIPIVVIIFLYYLIDEYVENKFLSIFLAYYGTSVIMSIIALLLFYFPNTIGGGFFEIGYVLFDFITINSIIDWIWKIQTDSWGIYYNWIIISSFVLINAGILVYKILIEYGDNNDYKG